MREKHRSGGTLQQVTGKMFNPNWFIGNVSAHVADKPRGNSYFREGLI